MQNDIAIDIAFSAWRGSIAFIADFKNISNFF